MKLSILRSAAFTLILAIAGNTSFAQSTDKSQKEALEEATVKAMVESKKFMFVPQSMMPMAGRSRQVSYGYDLTMSGDTVNAYLPYVGKSFTADYGSTNGAINFKTTDFQYLQKEGKKGGWDITITPKNIVNVRQVILRISSSGYTNVQVNSNTRDMISFYGYLQNSK